jgi:hypothetical protein
MTGKELKYIIKNLFLCLFVLFSKRKEKVKHTLGDHSGVKG